jgi:hypothetical protein
LIFFFSAVFCTLRFSVTKPPPGAPLMSAQKKRTTDSVESAPKRHQSDENWLLEEAYAALEETRVILENEVTKDLDALLGDELSVDCDVHRQVAAILVKAPDVCRNVQKPTEAYDVTLERAAAKVAKAAELLADVISDPELAKWAKYISVLVEADLV